MKKGMFVAGFLSFLFMVSGCATTAPNNRADIDALNARVSALQGQMASKDEELSRLQSELREKESALSQAEAEKRAAQAQLDAERARAASKPAPKVDQYLK